MKKRKQNKISNGILFIFKSEKSVLNKLLNIKADIKIKILTWCKKYIFIIQKSLMFVLLKYNKIINNNKKKWI